MKRVKNLKQPYALAMLLAIALVVTALVPAAFAVDSAKQLTLTVLKYQPVPAEPGNFIDVWLQLSNRREAVQDVSVTLLPSYPFIPAEDEGNTVLIPAIPSLDEAVIKYRVFVDLEARNQEYNLTFMYHYGKQGGQIRFEAPIYVQATDASLSVERSDVVPQPLRPGANATLGLTLRNNGKIGLKDIDVNLDLTDNTFSTYGTGTYQRVNTIQPGQSYDISYSLISDPKAETRVHSFPVTLNFRDERNNRYNTTTRVSAIINAEPQLMVVVDGSTLTGTNQTGDVTFKVVNNGAVDIKFLTIELVPVDDYDVPSPSTTSYLGNLDADDFETEIFKVRARTLKPSFQVRLQYSDPFNNQHNQTFAVPMRIITAEESGTASSGSMMYIIGAVVVILLGWFGYRKLRKKHH